ncbi:Uncharacterised protein [Mycobacteroides abscessus subsp. abscessus]|nr:Uncharacterised protein [Mycobacteroides abscessus subsp. abscessus]
MAGRKSPSTTLRSAASRISVSRTTAGAIPIDSAASSTVNGPWVRAYRWTRSPTGSGTDSVNAAGTPSGAGTPKASRRRAVSSTAAHNGTPRMLTETIAPRRCNSVSTSSAAGLSSSRRYRKATSSVVRGPSHRSRSAISSASRALRCSSRRCSRATTAAMTAGSSSSRRSTRPSSCARSAVSRESAAARRSASGASSLYMNAPT